MIIIDGNVFVQPLDVPLIINDNGIWQLPSGRKLFCDHRI